MGCLPKRLCEALSVRLRLCVGERHTGRCLPEGSAEPTVRLYVTRVELLAFIVRWLSAGIGRLLLGCVVSLGRGLLGSLVPGIWLPLLTLARLAPAGCAATWPLILSALRLTAVGLVLVAVSLLLSSRAVRWEVSLCWVP